MNDGRKSDGTADFVSVSRETKFLGASNEDRENIFFSCSGRTGKLYRFIYTLL